MKKTRANKNRVKSARHCWAIFPCHGLIFTKFCSSQKGYQIQYIDAIQALSVYLLNMFFFHLPRLVYHERLVHLWR